MSAFKRIVVTVASGPGIASPNIDQFEVVREDLSEADVGHLDRLIAEADFFNLHETKPAFKIYDGPHKSHIAVEMSDGRAHSVAFLWSSISAPLQSLVTCVQKLAGGRT
jgi:hypothetical protein